MAKIKVIQNASRLSNAELIEFTRNFITRMTSNPYFVTPDMPLATGTTLVNAFELKYTQASDGGRIHTAEMRKARTLLLDYICKQAMYVDRIAYGDEAIILSSGFLATKKRGGYNRETFIVKHNEIEGSVTLRHKTDNGIKGWLWQYCQDPINPATWVNAGASTKANFTIKGLKQGVKYWFRASHLSKDGQSEWCVPYPLIVT